MVHPFLDLAENIATSQPGDLVRVGPCILVGTDVHVSYARRRFNTIPLWYSLLRPPHFYRSSMRLLFRVSHQSIGIDHGSVRRQSSLWVSEGPRCMSYQSPVRTPSQKVLENESYMDCVRDTNLRRNDLVYENASTRKNRCVVH